MKICFVIICILLLIFIIVVNRNNKRESFQIAKRHEIICPIREEKQYSILPPNHKVLIVQGQNYERVPQFFSNSRHINPLKFSWNSDELTYYFVIQYLPHLNEVYSIRVSENIEPLITDGDGKRIELVPIKNSKYYEYYLKFN